MQLPVDEIYLLNLVENQKKYERMRERIKYMGFDVKDFRVVKHPISDVIAQNVPNMYGIANGGVFNCTREEYTIIKSAYLRGLNNVGIIEDDASFLRDKQVWADHFNNLPEDWDVLRVNSLRGGYEESYTNTNAYWTKQQNTLFGTGFYILNRKAMEYMIKCIDAKYQPIDNPISYPTNHVNIYLPKIELSLCLEDSFESDLRENVKLNPIHNKFKTIKRFKQENYI